MKELKRFEAVQCADCDGELHERIPTASAGDESWWECPDCRTIEGTWNRFENCACNPSGDECGAKDCGKCEGKGWVKE